MQECEQGAFVNIYKRKKIFIRAFSRDSQGVRLSGHGKLQKHALSDDDAAIGASVRLCINNRQPGHYAPHMYKEREAYLVQWNAFLEDLGMSERQFRNNTDSFHIYLWDDRIEYALYYDDPARWEPHITLPLSATDEELGRALRQTYEYLLTLD